MTDQPPVRSRGILRGAESSEWVPVTGNNCGTGAGGFQAGNTCATGGGSSGGASSEGRSAMEARHEEEERTLQKAHAKEEQLTAREQKQDDKELNQERRREDRILEREREKEDYAYEREKDRERDPLWRRLDRQQEKDLKTAKDEAEKAAAKARYQKEFRALSDRFDREDEQRQRETSEYRDRQDAAIAKRRQEEDASREVRRASLEKIRFDRYIKKLDDLRERQAQEEYEASGLSDEPAMNQWILVSNNCGTGAGGFQPGNTCSGGGSGNAGGIGGKGSGPTVVTRDISLDATQAEIRDWLHESIDKQDHLADGAKAEYKEAVSHVVESMPPGAIDRIGRSLKSVEWHADTAGVTKVYETLARTKAVGDVLGFFEHGGGKLVLDGKTEIKSSTAFGHGPADSVASSGTSASRNIHGVYSHELAHVIDRGGIMSRTPEWQKAYAKEIVGNKAESAPLSEYGRTAPHEGFAEFGRLVYGSGAPLDRIKGRFPECYRLWRNWKLVEG